MEIEAELDEIEAELGDIEAELGEAEPTKPSVVWRGSRSIKQSCQRGFRWQL